MIKNKIVISQTILKVEYGNITGILLNNKKIISLIKTFVKIPISFLFLLIIKKNKLYNYFLILTFYHLIFQLYLKRNFFSNLIEDKNHLKFDSYRKCM